MSKELSDQEVFRREALSKLREYGINPYPAELFDVNVTAVDIKENYSARKLDYKNINIAGRIMSRRIMGKASFVELQDSSGRIQLYFNRDEICPGENKDLYNTIFKKLLDIGDFIGVNGYVFTTKVGEISIFVKSFVVLAKTIRPLPLPKTDAQGNIYDSFTDYI